MQNALTSHSGGERVSLLDVEVCMVEVGISVSVSMYGTLANTATLVIRVLHQWCWALHSPLVLKVLVELM